MSEISSMFSEALNEYNSLDESLKKIEYKPLPAGTYNLRVESFEIRERKGASGPSIKYSVADGQHRGKFVWEDELYKGDNISPKAKATKLRNIFNFIKACGYDPNSFDEDSSAFIGKVVEAKVTCNEFAGKMYNNVDRVSASKDYETSNANEFDSSFEKEKSQKEKQEDLDWV